MLGTAKEPESLQTEAYFTCRRWLVRTADLLRKVQLSGRKPTHWQLRDVLSVLQAESLQAPPVLEVKLAAGTTLRPSDTP